MTRFSEMTVEEQVAHTRARAMKVAGELELQLVEDGEHCLHVVRNGKTLFTVRGSRLKPEWDVWMEASSSLLHIQSYNIQLQLEALARDAAPALEPVVIPNEALA